MFDIGFWELTVIGVVALLVIGPERLPGVARTAGVWAGRFRRFLTSVKADVDRELKAEELKRVMREQAESSGIHELVEETRDGLSHLDKPDHRVAAGEKEESAPVAGESPKQSATTARHDER